MSTTTTTVVEHKTLEEEAYEQEHPSVSDHCLVCYSDLQTTGITACGHNHICGLCHLRLRHLHSDKKCPICKATNDRVIVDEPGKVWDEYPMWGDELGGNFIFRQDVGMFFTNPYHVDEIQPLFGYHCTVPQCSYDGITPEQPQCTMAPDHKKNPKQRPPPKKSKNPVRALQDHLRVKHRLTICKLCIDFKRDFVSRLPRFTPTQLKHHQEKGDGDTSGFKGHPVCEFCKPKRFYDLTQLHLHLQKDHYKCHICEKQGKANQYFRDYQALEKHFDRHHLLCKDPQCLAARFVVFENEIDLRAHELHIHGGTATGDTKIQLEFRVRRTGYDGSGVDPSSSSQNVPNDEDFSFGVDGQAFVPEPLSRESQEQLLNESTSHPLHFARTEEMRAQAAAMRGGDDDNDNEGESSEQAFPSLSTTHNASGLRVGWTAGTSLASRNTRQAHAGEVTAEAFPALPPTNPRTNNNVAARIRGPANRGGSGGGGRGSSALWQSSQPMSASAGYTTNQADNFPSLGGGTVSNSSRPPQPQSQPTRKQSVPTANAFPSLPTGNAKKNSVAAKIKGVPKKTAMRQTVGAAGGGGALWSASSSNVRSAAPPTGGSFPALGGSNGGGGGSSSGSNYTAARNRTQDLAPGNFPSLGGPTTAHRYEAAEAYAKKNRAQVGGGSSGGGVSLSTNDFPPPITSSFSSSTKKTVKQKIMTTSQKAPSPQALSNVLQFPPPSMSSNSSTTDIHEGKATKEQIKAALGPTKFKRLKNLTKDFAVDDIAPEAYVDQAAALFETGFADSDFWSFVPALLSSCPNESSSQRALRYMEQVRATTVSSSTNTGSADGWSSSSSVAAAAVSRPSSNPPTTRYIVPTKKKNNWGNANNNNVSKMVSARPGSVSATSHGQTSAPNGTATKFMAKEKKKEISKNNQSNSGGGGGGKKNKKKKQKDELRALAFGK